MRLIRSILIYVAAAMNTTAHKPTTLLDVNITRAKKKHYYTGCSVIKTDVQYAQSLAGKELQDSTSKNFISIDGKK